MMDEHGLIKDILEKKKEFYELIDQGQKLDSEIVAKLVSVILVKLNVMFEESNDRLRQSTLTYKLIRLISKKQDYPRSKVILDEIERKYSNEKTVDFVNLFCLEAKYYLELLAGGGLVNRLDELVYNYKVLGCYEIAEFLYQTLLKYDQVRKSLAYIGLGNLYFEQADNLMENKGQESKEKVKEFWQQSVNYYEKAIDVVDFDEVPLDFVKGMSYGRLAEGYQKLKEYDLAVNACQEAIGWDEDNYYAYKVLNTIYDSSPESVDEEMLIGELSTELIQTKFNRMINNLWTNSLLAESKNELNNAKIYWKYLIELDATYSSEAKEKVEYYCNT